MFLEVSAASMEAQRLEHMYHEIMPAWGHTILAHTTASMWLADRIGSVGRAFIGCWAAPAVDDYALSRRCKSSFCSRLRSKRT
jgi:hypothetical protein